MSAANKYSQVLFGFQDDFTGDKLSEFFNKHTGKNVDFNKVKHFKSGFKLLLFSIPLDTFIQTSISAASAAPSNVKKFMFLDDFIDWYENEYSSRIRDIEKLRSFVTRNVDPEFEKKYEELGININAAFDPYPTFVSVRKPSFYRSETMVTFSLANGMPMNVPYDDLHRCVLLSNMAACTKNGKVDWDKLLGYLDMSATEYEIDNMTRYTPDNQAIKYPKEFDPDIEFLCDDLNDTLNTKQPFKYPSNWFEVVKKLMTFKGGVVECDGIYIAALMLAAPRDYLKYFLVDSTSEQIAREIYYDNL